LEFLEAARPLLEDHADFYEINPETTWRERDGRLERNDYHALFREVLARSGKPAVAHGLAFSPGTPIEVDAARTGAWMERLRDDQASFRYAWMSEHLGFTVADGLQAVLPLPLPYTDEAVATVAARMRRLAEVFGTVAFENNVGYFALDDPDDEPRFLSAICATAPCSMLLDLHNAWTQCRNHGLDADAWVDRLPLASVVEIHVSGGGDSDPEWLASGRTMRLDSHDHAVPEEVWRLYERTVPRCPGLRGVVVERLNGTFGPDDLPALADEIARAKDVFRC
jgi:uncharacterized protein (UPF0276 family)